MTLSKNDILDHHYWLVGCNVEKLAGLDGETAQYAMKTNMVDIRYTEQLVRFLNDFSPELSKAQKIAIVQDIINLHQKGRFFRYTNVTRN